MRPIRPKHTWTAVFCALTAMAPAAGQVDATSRRVSHKRRDAASTVVFCCAANNDLFSVVSKATAGVTRYDTGAKAVAAAADGSGVLILADGYPQKTTALDAAIYERAAEKRLRLFVEYPAALGGMKVGKPKSTHVERVVVASDFFGAKLKELRIVSINGLHYVPVECKASHLVAARVAGFDTAVYGLPKQTWPILFEMPGRRVLVATTCLSRFVTGRYAPQDSWRAIWGAILRWLCPGAKTLHLRWTPTVRATYGRAEALPADFETRAVRRGLAWYRKAKMVVHPSFEKQVAGKSRVDSLPADAPIGDGSLGAMEAVVSVIGQDGSQRISSVQRIDCICETAMAMALGGGLLKDQQKIAIGAKLLDYAHFTSNARKNERGDPKNGNYGLIAWGITNPAWYKANYGDDNARVMLSTLAVAGARKDGRWDEAMMMCLLANLRTTGQLGFRSGRIDIGALNKGWRRYFHSRRVNIHPHYECYLWACYLWAYEQTRDELFLNRAETALKMTMAQYTDGWSWTNGLAQEKARILLPLAWLVRAKDTPANRAMLRKAVDGLLALQDKCGAIREQLGRPGKGQFPPPRSNAAYGTNEASLIAANGDPVADLLYTTNFAFLGLHEAAAATGDKDVIQAENKLAEFLCRIQVTSDAQPAVDGGWFRAFDFGRWEHWGCNADHGWGAWAIESGWTQGWITAVLAMRQRKTSLWDLTRDSKIERHHARLRKQMIPEDAMKPPEVRAAAKAKKVSHAAVGKTVKHAAMPSPHYFALGAKSLVDGRLSGPDYMSGQWLGFHGDDLDAVVDLGRPTEIHSLGANFLQSVGVGIFLPVAVTFSVSDDGQTFREVAVVKHDVGLRQGGPLARAIEKGGLDLRARHVRVRAENVGVIPKWHAAGGTKAWLFVDELTVNREDKR